MRFSRRSLLSLVVVAPTAGILTSSSARAADGAQGSSLRTERTLGSPDAPVTVLEFFSLTCTHCAAFSRTTFPRVKTELIDTGKIRFVFNDFPLDKVALAAAAVARTLPPERYEPFVQALFANQDRWAFGRGIDNKEELWKTAALAGMSRPIFDAAYEDVALKEWIIAEQNAAQLRYKIEATPSFVINGHKSSGALDFKGFSDLITSAA